MNQIRLRQSEKIIINYGAWKLAKRPNNDLKGRIKRGKVPISHV